MNGEGDEGRAVGNGGQIRKELCACHGKVHCAEVVLGVRSTQGGLGVGLFCCKNALAGRGAAESIDK